MSQRERIDQGSDSPVHKTFLAKIDRHGSKRHEFRVLWCRDGAQSKADQTRTIADFPEPAANDGQESEGFQVLPSRPGFPHCLVRRCIEELLPSVLPIRSGAVNIGARECSQLSNRSLERFGALRRARVSAEVQDANPESCRRMVSASVTSARPYVTLRTRAATLALRRSLPISKGSLREDARKFPRHVPRKPEARLGSLAAMWSFDHPRLWLPLQSRNSTRFA